MAEPVPLNGYDVWTLVGIGACTAIGLLGNDWFSRNVAVGLPVHDGCPMWSWYIGAIMQGIVYPAMVFLAFRDKGYDLVPWLDAGWQDHPSFLWEKAFLYSFFGYLLKDMLIMTDLLFILHHIACMVGVLLTLYLPRGAVALVLGMVLLELGSFCMCLSFIMPKAGPKTDPNWDRLFWIGMTVSNALCGVCCAYNAFFVDFGLPNNQQMFFKGLLATITIILCLLRQKACMENMSDSTERYAKLKKR